MKILFISPYPPNPGGTGAYTARLVEKLRKLNNTVFIVSHKGAKGKGVYPLLRENDDDYCERSLEIVKKLQPNLELSFVITI